MDVMLEYPGTTVIESNDSVMIYDKNDVLIVEITDKVRVFGVKDNYDKSPSEDFKHLKVFL